MSSRQAGGPDVGGRSPSLAVTVRAAIGGDEQAFAELYALLEPVARRSAMRAARGLPQLDVEETVNLALTRVWKALDTFEDDRELIPWAAVVIAHAVRSAARVCRSTKAQVSWGAMLAPAVSDGVPPDTTLQRLPADVRTDADILRRETEDSIVVLLSELLSEREAMVMRMRMAGWTYAEISDAMGVNLKAVDNALRRAIDRLKRAFGTEEELVASLHEASRERA